MSYRSRPTATGEHHNGLATRQTIGELVAVYERAERDIRHAFQLLSDVQLYLGSAFSGEPGDRIYLRSKHRDRADYDHPEETIQEVQRAAWNRLVDRLQVKQFMSVAAAKELDRQLDHDEMPPITLDNVMQILNGFQAQASAMLKDAVHEVFEFLRPRDSKYKRNSEYEVPPRVVLTWMVESYHSGKMHIRYEREAQVMALENVMHSLQGKGSTCKTHKPDLCNAVLQSSEGETDLFLYRACKNGNLHLTFKDRDLLARFNQMAGGARLRPAPHDTKR